MSKMGLVYFFLKKKFDVFEIFKKNEKVMVNIEIDIKIKSFRSNNGEKYIDRDVKKYCDVNDINMEKIVPITP